MATVAEIEQQIAALRAQLGGLREANLVAKGEIRGLERERNDLFSRARFLDSQGDTAGAAELRAQIPQVEAKIGELYQSPAFANLTEAELQIQKLEADLYAAQQKAKFEEQQAKQPPATEERTAEQKAESDRTTPVVDKPAPVPPEGAGNENPPPTSEKPQQTQQTVAQDDQPQNSVAANTQQAATVAGNASVASTIVPQPNILDKFASNTWAASVYLLSPQQYTAMVRSKKKQVNGYNLLFQSGGAPNNVGGFQGALAPGYSPKDVGEGANQGVAAGVPVKGVPDAGRNPAFNQDFYIDSITFDNLLPGKQTQGAHSVSTLKFTVTEPGNITLLDRIYAAVKDMAQTLGSSKEINYTAAQYLMVIRWYGYDINGNLIHGTRANDKTALSDPKAIVEKFIPFTIRQINWSVTSKLVNYEFECVPVGQSVAGGTRRGTIPYDVQLSAQTVGELLSGNAVYASLNSKLQQDASGRKTASTDPRSFTAVTVAEPARVATPATQSSVRSVDNSIAATGAPPPKTNSAPTNKTTLKSGLAGAMTEYAEKLVSNERVYEAADTYRVVFDQSAKDIQDATIVLPGTIIDQDGVPMGVPAEDNPNQSLSPAKNGMNVKARNWSITAGQQMLQAIDLAIRNSSYIYQQGLTIYDSDSGKEISNPKAAGKKMKWYKVSMQATPGEYDPARNDFAYDITYIISAYDIPNFESKYFPLGNFRGVHKRYPYWFTGENTAVLDFTANFNAAYNMTVSGGPDVDSADAQLRKKVTSNTRDLVKYSYSPASSETRQGGKLKGTESSANAAEYLYAVDQPGGSTLKIIGDPAWIQQGSLCGGITETDMSSTPFDVDGTINFDSSQVLFEIAWQRPEDYDINTGVANPYARPGNTPGQPVQTNVYQATKVTNELHGGKFEQTITGILYHIPVPDAKKAEAAATNDALAASWKNNGTTPGADTSAPADDSVNRAEDARFARQGREQAATPSADTESLAQTGQTAGVTSTNPYANAGRFAAAGDTGAITAPPFSTPDYSASAISGTSSGSSTPPITPADTVANSGYPRAPTGAGVNPITFGEPAPQPLNNPYAGAGRAATAANPITFEGTPVPVNNNPYASAGRTQLIAKDY